MIVIAHGFQVIVLFLQQELLELSTTQGGACRRSA